MAQARFRVSDRGKMLVIDPDGEAKWTEVIHVYDATNGMVGIQLKKSQLAGYTFLIFEGEISGNKGGGQPANALRVPK